MMSNNRLDFPPSVIEFPGDVAKLQVGLRARGYDHSDAKVQAMWADYSEGYYAAGWMGVSDEADAERLIRAYRRAP